MLSVCQSTQIPMIGKVNNGLEKTWNEAIMAKYKVQSQPNAGANEENKNKKSQFSVGKANTRLGRITTADLFIRKSVI